MKKVQRVLALNSVRINPSRHIVISSLSMVEALHVLKEEATDDPMKANIQSLIDLIHELRPTI